MKSSLESRISGHSSHLQENLLMLRGRVVRGQAPRFSLPQLLPVVIVLACTATVVASRKARNSLILKLALLVSTRLLQSSTVLAPKPDYAENFPAGENPR